MNFIFHFIYGMSSFPLTSIFFKMVIAPPTRLFLGVSHDHIAPGATDSMGSGSSVLASLAAPMAQRAGRWQRAVVATPGVRCWGWLGGAGSGYQWIGLTANLQETIDFVMKYGCFL
jgi:hypothetical protein